MYIILTNFVPKDRGSVCTPKLTKQLQQLLINFIRLAPIIHMTLIVLKAGIKPVGF